MSKRNQRVDASGASRGHIRREQRDGGEADRHRCVRRGVNRCETEQHAGQVARQAERASQTGSDPSSDQHDALPHDHPQDFPALGTQRHTNPDLLGSVAYFGAYDPALAPGVTDRLVAVAQLSGTAA